MKNENKYPYRVTLYHIISSNRYVPRVFGFRIRPAAEAARIFAEAEERRKKAAVSTIGNGDAGEGGGGGGGLVSEGTGDTSTAALEGVGREGEREGGKGGRLGGSEGGGRPAKKARGTGAVVSNASPPSSHGNGSGVGADGGGMMQGGESRRERGRKGEKEREERVSFFREKRSEAN